MEAMNLDTKKILYVKSAEWKYEREGMMFQQRRRIQLPVLGIILLCLLGGVYLFAIRRSAKSDSEDTIKKHSVDTSANDALKYWTKGKMRKAKPAELPHIKDGEQGKKRPHAPQPRNSD